MTTLLEQALDQLRKCTPAEQDTIAALILEELADDTRWEEAFAASRPEIEQLAEKCGLNFALVKPATCGSKTCELKAGR